VPSSAIAGQVPSTAARVRSVLRYRRANARRADEYDAAQERGEVRGANARTTSSPEAVGVSDIGLTRKDIFEARQLEEWQRALQDSSRLLALVERLVALIAVELGGGDLGPSSRRHQLGPELTRGRPR
jgi:hypothetical protein